MESERKSAEKVSETTEKVSREKTEKCFGVTGSVSEENHHTGNVSERVQNYFRGCRKCSGPSGIFSDKTVAEKSCPSLRGQDPTNRGMNTIRVQPPFGGFLESHLLGLSQIVVEDDIGVVGPPTRGPHIHGRLGRGSSMELPSTPFLWLLVAKISDS